MSNINPKIINKTEGLAPIVGPQSRAVILGSFPSATSLQECQYYAYKQNQFWPIMQRLFGIVASLPYAKRCDALCESRLAVWDVIGYCRREGSSDNQIRDPEANDFAAFYQRHPQIVAVFWNGKAAQRCYEKLVGDAGPAGIGLPSTSPANTVGLAIKLRQWQQVCDTLEQLADD